MPLSSWAWGAGRVHDILVWDSDAVWRARGTNHPPTFSGSAAVSMVAGESSMLQGTYLQWCFLMKMLNWV